MNHECNLFRNGVNEYPIYLSLWISICFMVRIYYQQIIHFSTLKSYNEIFHIMLSLWFLLLVEKDTWTYNAKKMLGILCLTLMTLTILPLRVTSFDVIPRPNIGIQKTKYSLFFRSSFSKTNYLPFCVQRKIIFKPSNWENAFVFSQYTYYSFSNYKIILSVGCNYY